MASVTLQVNLSLAVRSSREGARLLQKSSVFSSSSSVFGKNLLKPSAYRSSVPVRSMGARASTATFEGQSVYDFTVKDIKGVDTPLSKFKGKVLLIVNVASQCGLTASNYTELTGLYNKYKDQGLEILAFPCNQFGGQEPGSNDQISDFVCTRYKGEFPVFDKIDVNGPNAAPLYQFLKSKKGGMLGSDIKWNFGKFLVDKEGNVVERYAPTTSPTAIEGDIKKIL